MARALPWRGRGHRFKSCIVHHIFIYFYNLYTIVSPDKPKINRIACAGGSTGGHVVPISTLIQTISSTISPTNQGWSIQFFWFGEKKSMEEQECHRLSNSFPWVHFVPIVSGKVRRKPDLHDLLLNIRDIVRLVRWVIQSIYWIKVYGITSIFSKGGFVSLPVVIAGRIRRIPLIVHESDTKPWLSTRIASWFTDTVFTGFPHVLPKGKYVWHITNIQLVQGMNEIRDHENNDQPMTKKKPTIMVNCGSLGSTSVHEAVLSIMSTNKILCAQFDRIVLLGRMNTSFRPHYEHYPYVKLYEFVDQKTLWKLYYQADSSICRGGSTTLVEQHLFGIRQIIVPIPWTHDQSTNAEYFVRQYDDCIVRQHGKQWYQDLEHILDTLTTYHKDRVNIHALDDQIQQPLQQIIKAVLIL